MTGTGQHPDQHKAHMPRELRDKAMQRLILIEGQVRGIQRMVEGDRYCPEVLTQVEAVREALRQVGMIVLRNYLDQCVTDAVVKGDSKVYDELMDIVNRYSR